MADGERGREEGERGRERHTETGGRAEPEGNCFIEVACRANDESGAAIYLQFAFDLPTGFIATRNAN